MLRLKVKDKMQDLESKEVELQLKGLQLEKLKVAKALKDAHSRFEGASQAASERSEVVAHMLNHDQDETRIDIHRSDLGKGKVLGSLDPLSGYEMQAVCQYKCC